MVADDSTSSRDSTGPSSSPESSKAHSFPGVETLLTGELGGEASVAATGDSAFSLPVRGLTSSQRNVFLSGEALFRREFGAEDGLGPTYLTTSCASCHVRDGRGSPLTVGIGNLVLVDPRRPDLLDTYGTQIQTSSNPGIPAEAAVSVRWQDDDLELDGLSTSLRRPDLDIAGAAFGPLEGSSLTLRVAPPLHGSGLLEAVEEATIGSLADPGDENGDGISGRIPSLEVESGRFGWKATQAALTDQVAAALHEDMGITSTEHTEENCPPVQTACAELPPGEPLSSGQLKELAGYVRMLGVPVARTWETPSVQAGYELFGQIGCAECHVATLTTGSDEIDALSRQTIHPFTDLLLHDMGEDLADPYDSAHADAAEWRTPPLWGIGLNATVSGETFLLHDGRALSVEEAILWHGGEAQSARDRFVGLDEDQRVHLLEFLDSL